MVWSLAVPSWCGRWRLEKREPRLNVAATLNLERGSRSIDYLQVIVNRSPQNRLSFRLRLSSVTALSSASRFNCAGVVYHPPAPPYVAKSIQTDSLRYATVASLAFHAKCFLTTPHCRYSSVATNQKLSTTLATRKKNIRRLCSLRLKTLNLRKCSEKSGWMFFFNVYSGFEIQ